MLVYGTFEDIDSERKNQSIPVAGTQDEENGEDWEGKEGWEDEEAAKKYRLFRNGAAKIVLEHNIAIMRGKTCEGGHGGGDGDGEGGSGNGKKDLFESTIMQLSWLNARIMNILKCSVLEENSRGQKKKKYVDASQKFLPFFMWKFSEDLFIFFKEWEAQDFKNGTWGTLKKLSKQ